MPEVEVIVPWQEGCPHRAAALEWVTATLRRSAYGVTLAALAPGEPWCKALALEAAIAASRADILVVHDADVWAPGLERAVDDVAAGAAWAIPHNRVLRLDETSTAQVLAGSAIAPDLALSERPYSPTLGGGIVVLQRDVALDIPLDPRFVGWGQEDMSWGLALHTLAGPAQQRAGWLFHLWHPPQARLSRRWGSPEGRALARRYATARTSPDEMRALIQEATPWRSPT